MSEPPFKTVGRHPCPDPHRRRRLSGRPGL